MIETLMMAGSLAIMGYAFYVSSRMSWSSRKDAKATRWIYPVVSAFTFATYVTFAFVMLSFLTDFFGSAYIFDVVNSVLGVLLLSGSALVAALMKCQVSGEVSRPLPAATVTGEAKKPAKRRAAWREGSEAAAYRKEIERLQKELDAASMLNKLAVGRELKIIELKKRVEELEGRGG